MTVSPTLLVVDDHPVFRGGIASLFEAAGYEVVGEAASAAEAVAMARATSPDVVLMDLGLPDDSGIAATAHIVGERPATKVVVVTMFDDDGSVRQALAAGATGTSSRMPRTRRSLPPSPRLCRVRSCWARAWRGPREDSARNGSLWTTPSVSPRGKLTCWISLRGDSPTARSPNGLASPGRPSRTMCRSCWPSATRSTGCSLRLSRAARSDDRAARRANVTHDGAGCGRGRHFAIDHLPFGCRNDGRTRPRRSRDYVPQVSEGATAPTALSGEYRAGGFNARAISGEHRPGVSTHERTQTPDRHREGGKT